MIRSQHELDEQRRLAVRERRQRVGPVPARGAAAPRGPGGTRAGSRPTPAPTAAPAPGPEVPWPGALLVVRPRAVLEDVQLASRMLDELPRQCGSPRGRRPRSVGARPATAVSKLRCGVPLERPGQGPPEPRVASVTARPRGAVLSSARPSADARHGARRKRASASSSAQPFGREVERPLPDPRPAAAASPAGPAAAARRSCARRPAPRPRHSKTYLLLKRNFSTVARSQS
jgi:hypothetical protein